MKRVAAALVLGGVIAACVVSSFGEGEFACERGKPDTCPEGLICARDNVCRSQELAEDVLVDTGPASDVEPPDAGIECPEAAFNVSLEGRRAHAVAATEDGRVYIGGVQNGQGFIAEMHPCNGSILRERVISGALSFDAITVAGDLIAAVGAATGTNTTGFGRFSRDLVTISFLPSDGYGGPSEHVNVGANGSIWLAGPRGTATGFVALTGTCSVNLPSTPGGVVANGSNALVLLRGASTASLERILSTCAREDGGVGTIKAGASDMRPRQLIPLASGYAAIGTAVAPAPRQGTLAWIAASNGSGSTWEKTELDPNPNANDEGRAIAFDGEFLFAGVSQRSVANGGVPTLVRYGIPLLKDVEPTWSAAPFGAADQREIRGVAAAKGREGVFVVATDGTNGAFARCTKKGTCR